MRNLLVLVLVNAMWAFQFSGAKIATEQMGPISVALIPLAISTLLLAPLMFVRTLRSQTERVPIGAGRAFFEFVILALFGPIPAQLALVWGVERSLASNAAVLNLTIPVVTAFIAWILIGEKMTATRWISFALALVGAVIVSAGDLHSAELLKGRYATGNLLIMISCFGSAFNNTYSKRLLRHFTPFEVLLYGFAMSTLFLIPPAVFFEHDSLAKAMAMPADAWISLGVIAVFSLSLSMLLFLWVIDRIDVTQASLSIYLLPVFGIIFSSLTLHEPISPELVIGGALVVVSTFLVTIYEEMKNRKASYSTC